ncbi:ABC transporter ATP-binding protein [Lacibacter sediminis]|uniref:ATP-binding cassette domain-containing protein n=2 Tax=Lacibacter TaxID=649461 RepID=A0A7G5XCX0_9BACT|nr:ATP-binding cassette domain-containing protein [Lacibacter sediminis]QNA43323.1 ATP-binding cassette domain-containing protein [Lacibacter sediminis]
MSNVTEQDITNTLPKTTVENPVIDIRQLKKSFGSQEILKDITLQLGSGENLVVMGKSGSGKSVLIKCLVGLLTPDSGSITILEQDVTGLQRKELNQLRQKIGFLFQSGALYDSMTVKQNIEFPLRRIKKGLTEKEITEKVQEVLENVDLVDALNKMPSALSGGMRKRISLARTIVVDPLIMLYDEPTTGLDPVTSDEISALIMDVQKKYKTSSIIITHDIKCALHTANRMIMLKDGTVFKEGKPEEFKQSTDEYIQSFSFQ